MSAFLFLYRIESRSASPEEMQRQMTKWMAWMQDLSEKGHLKDAGQPLDLTGKVVKGVDQATVLDGPYAETKDLVCGFSIIEAQDIDQAAELAAGCPILCGGGMVEVRPVIKM